MTDARACLIVGRPNVGKTLFLIQFARYLGLKSAAFTFVDPGGVTVVESLTPARARLRLVSARPHETRRLQHVEVSLNGGRTRRPLLLTDSTGVPERVHPHPDVRRGVVQTLRALQEAAVVLHVIDAAELGEQGWGASISPVDDQIARFAAGRCPYLVLANKMDLSWSRPGYGALRRALEGRTVVPVSALRGTGFREVRAFLSRHL